MSIDEDRLRAKVQWRLGLPAIAFMLLSALDRVNISFAALHMNSELGLTPGQYGFGAGIVFVGFLAGQYPSVLLLQRIGMRRWIGSCALCWGVCSAGTAFVRTPLQFDVLRVIVGFAESGLAPGIVLYLSQFTTRRERASTFAVPMLAIPLAIVIGSPLSGWLLHIAVHSAFGAWRWMLMIEALPALLLGMIAWFYFPDRPEDARWLTQGERRWLTENALLASRTRPRNDWSVLRTPQVWGAALLWFGLLAGAYGIMFWLPQIVQQLTKSGALEIGFVNALPWAGVMAGIYYNARHSDKTGERHWHVALPAFLAGVSLLVAWSAGAGALGLLGLLAVGLGLGAAQGAFWAVPAALLSPARLAVAVVAINIFGSSGGLVMPHLIGVLREDNGNFVAPTMMMSVILVLSGVLALLLKRGDRPAHPGDMESR